MARAISIETVLALKRGLEESGLPVTLHMHDACGAQSFSLELVGQEGLASIVLKSARALILERLEESGAPEVKFSDDGMRFWVVK